LVIRFLTVVGDRNIRHLARQQLSELLTAVTGLSQ
jgi:hypothetical protein